MVQGLRLAVGIGLALGFALILGAAARRGVARSASAKTDQSYLGHLDELRRRILWSVAAIVAGMSFAFGFRMGPDPWWLPRPALHDTFAAQAYRLLADHLVPEGVRVVAMRPTAGLTAEITVSLIFGLVAASPIVVGHAVAFLGPALRPNEARALRRALVPTVLLFLAGAAFAIAYVAPALLEALYGYADALGAEPLLGVSDLVGFAGALVLLFGLAFEAPLVMTVLSRSGVVPSHVWWKYWRHATVAILLVSALITDGTIVTLALVTLPIVGLYFVGAAGARWAGRKRNPDL